MSKEEAGVLLAKLRPREVEAITRELMRLGSVEVEDVDDVMNKFHGLMTAQQFVGRGGVEFAREILAAGLGEDKAEGILSRLNVVYTEVPFASLRNADVRQLVTFLKDEHAQIIALVLAHLPAAQSAEVLSGFAPEQQAEVAHRIATMDRTSPEMVRLVEEELGRRMGSILAHQDMSTAGGVEALVRVGEEARIGLDGVLEGRAVDHHGVRHRFREATGEDHGAHDEVVGQREVRSDVFGDLPHRVDVRIEVVVELLPAQLGERLGADALVAIRDVDRQHVADVRPVGGAADRLAQRLHGEPAVAPLAHRVDELQSLGVTVLAEQVDLVPGAPQCRGEVRVVDVGTRPGEQIAVEHQDSHAINRPFDT